MAALVKSFRVWLQPERPLFISEIVLKIFAFFFTNKISTKEILIGRADFLRRVKKRGQGEAGAASAATHSPRPTKGGQATIF